MKKAYIKPAVTVHSLTTTNILAGSDEYINLNSGNTLTNDSQVGAKRFRGVWDSDVEEDEE